MLREVDLGENGGLCYKWHWLLMNLWSDTITDQGKEGKATGVGRVRQEYSCHKYFPFTTATATTQ